jgi:Reverse transcriptase (RNA-dependent DNA polymerase)
LKSTDFPEWTPQIHPHLHGPHTLTVGSANYAQELGASSRTIRVYGTSVGAVDIGDDVPHKAVHVPLQVYHRSFQALADSGASVSCISAVTFAVLRRRCRDIFLVPSDKLFHTYDGKQSRCMGTTVLSLTRGTLTVKVKLKIVQNLVSDFILGVNYLFALLATLDFDHEVFRLCYPASGLRFAIGFTNLDSDRRQVYSVCAPATVPLGPYEQRRVPVRMPLDRVGRPGLLSQDGAVSMGAACVAHGYFGEVPATTSIFIANPTSEHVIVRTGTRVGSILPTHLDADVPLTIGAVCMQDITSWVDFDNLETEMSPVLDTVATVRCAPADESTTPPMWKIQTDFEVNSDLDAQQRTRLGEFILSAAIGSPGTTSEFSTSNDLGRANEKWSSHFHVIDTGDAGSRTGSYEPRRNPRSNAQIDKLVDDRLELDFIEPSRSPRRFPFIRTPKPDGSTRFCVDYWRLNEETIPDALPRQDDTMDALGGSTIFSVLDLSHRFHQLPLDKASRAKTAFSTRRGLYQLNTVPFGIRNCPAVFQRLLDSVLAWLTFGCCLIYLDDIIVYSKSFEQHRDVLDKVFSALLDAGLS